MGITRSRALLPLVVGALSLLVHSVPFLLYGTHPLGYDTGFYRRYLIQPFETFPNTVVPGLGGDALLPRVALDTLRALSLPTDLILYGSYAIFASLVPLLLFYWLRPRLGTRGAAIASVLLALSPVAYTAYWYMLYKNAFALCLILLAFIAYERRLVWPTALLGVAIALSHKTSAIIYIATLCVLLVTDRSRWREQIVYLFTATLALALVWYGASVSVPSFGAGTVAVFLEWGDYVTLSFGLVLAAAYALMRYRELALPHTLVAFGLASFAFPIFHLPFYQRIFVFTDVALAALAACGVVLVVQRIDFDSTRRSYLYFVLLCVVAGFHLGNLHGQVAKLQPLVTTDALAHIERAGALVPPDAVLLTTNHEAPWYEGWTLAHIAAPGMLRDRHSYEEWVTFWDATSTPAQIAFLNTFPQPLYISTTGAFEELINTPPPCLTEIAQRLLLNECR